jgi:hypothetical protein
MADGEFTRQSRWKFVVQVAVSGVVLVGCLIIILTNKYSDATMKWALGLVGVVIGYWLR